MRERIKKMKDEKALKKEAKLAEKEKLAKMTKEEKHAYLKEKRAKEKEEAKLYGKGFWVGFKNFIARGNILDMAVGVVIGTAFTAIVNALVNGIILQFVALLTGNANFSDLAWNIDRGLDPDGNPIIVAIKYGAFIQAIINFFIIAFVIYLVVNVLIKRQISKDIQAAKEAAEKEAEEANKEPEVPADIALLTEIRDYLKDLNNK